MENVEISSVTSTSFYVSWLPSNLSVQDSYKVIIQGLTNNSFQFESQNVTETGVSIPGLTHSSNYSVTVVTYSKGVVSEPSEAVIMNTGMLSKGCIIRHT